MNSVNYAHSEQFKHPFHLLPLIHLFCLSNAIYNDSLHEDMTNELEQPAKLNTQH